MGKYDNYSNQKNIAKAQKKLDRLLAKKKQDLYAIDMAKKELETAKLFESCQVFDPSASIMFSDDNEVIWFCGKLIRYADLVSYAFVENKVTKADTTTKKKGTVSRAIIGGALLGGVGAVVGAASAGSKSETTYYEVTDGYNLQVVLADNTAHQVHFESAGIFSNKIPKTWLALGTKLQTIIENNM